MAQYRRDEVPRGRAAQIVIPAWAATQGQGWVPVSAGTTVSGESASSR